MHGQHARARGEKTAPEHVRVVKTSPLLDGEQHASDGRGERHRDARGRTDGDEISFVTVVSKPLHILQLETQRVRSERAQSSTD